VWRWDQQEPFGNDTPNGDPGNTGTTFDLALRLPGQYYDKETGLHQNINRDYDPSLGIYKESDPIGIRAGNNTYAYVASDPLAGTDPTGLWSTEVHNILIKAYFEKENLSPQLLKAIQNGSARTDDYQSPSDAFMHAMRARGQSMSDAREKACRFIEANLLIYRSLKGSPIHKQRIGAYRALGAALHVAMDSTSPSHRGFQIWDPLHSPFESRRSHGNNSPEDRDALTKELMNETLDVMRRTLTGDACSCAR
jgi:RHS repeat-associated protein